ncbi:Asp-tRNA(Asn)/Glu-tRNA(Gln) amidotransferase A subunit family amidase [Roseibium hamelinense]|uniref:Asp-tRNA(Asn)/Glu-tRNA(Gln) amidotransferase A subunit family amidase n=1 Tax=Roseibium hamelinense TaxID=150831 RepID=A0A562T2U0_9HYPH|nr:amidase [Roseibium hamelinense]MTI43345.1 amidase [Roseibium hamelinense]TWI87544.1 Asp-tRNA(Asn)/Glu-tRNA(Gln) amidotransferase A subunit family amidase [Roseibium hamelinense]
MPVFETPASPASLSAIEAAQAIKAGQLSSENLVLACLEQISRTDPTIHAWAFLDPGAALEQARMLDRHQAMGHSLGRLHGVPVGIKDIIDTADMPTECGSPAFAGFQPTEDAEVVRNLKTAGAVIMGKTVTTEIAFLHPAATRNPHNQDRTPGGSSSGSAAAVAAYQIPLALGTQTNGSVIRPAAFCGVVGYKPTRGTISRAGVLQTSQTLDQIGGFARTVEDTGLLAAVVSGSALGTDRLGASPAIHDLKLAYLDMPFSNRLTEDSKRQFERLLDTLGPSCTRIDAPAFIADLVVVQKVLHEYEINLHLGDVLRSKPGSISRTLKPVLERALQIDQQTYKQSFEAAASADAAFEELFSGYDALITPSTTGPAPPAENGTGDPIFCSVWTVGGLPAITLPLLTSSDGMPLGVQIISAKGSDRHLVSCARSLMSTVI